MDPVCPVKDVALCEICYQDLNPDEKESVKKGNVVFGVDMDCGGPMSANCGVCEDPVALSPKDIFEYWSVMDEEMSTINFMEATVTFERIHDVICDDCAPKWKESSIGDMYVLTKK